MAEGTGLVALEGTAASLHGPETWLCAEETRLFPKAFSKQKPYSAVAVSRTLLHQVMLLSIPLCPPQARGACPAWGTLGLAEGEGVSLHPGLNLVSTVHHHEPQSRQRP